MRNTSRVAPGWWDYTTLDREILDDAARLSEKDIRGLARPGFEIHFYDTVQEFYLAEALEYIDAWRQATAAKPAGLCGPIGPTEQLPLVAQLVNALGLNLRHCHYWGMDEWVVDGKEASLDFPLGFARTARELCFDRIRPELALPKANLHFPAVDADVWLPGLLAGHFGSKNWMAARMGKAGGKVRSPAKTAACRANGAKGGRPRKRAA